MSCLGFWQWLIGVMMAKAFLSYGELAEMKTKVQHAKDMAELEALISKYRKAVEQVKLMQKAVLKSHTKVNGHIANMKRQVEREQAKRKREEESQEMQKVKAQAKLAAKKVARQAAEVAPFFAMGLDKLIGEGLAKDWVVFSPEQVLDVEVPCLFRSTSAVTSWSSQAKVQVALGYFGGRYKKTDGYNQDRQGERERETRDRNREI